MVILFNYISKYNAVKKNILCGVFLLVMIALSGCSTNAQMNASKSTNDIFDVVKNADAAYDDGRWLEAEQGYQKVIKKVPQDYYAWFRLGNTQLRQGRIDNAIEAYKQAAARNPDQAKPLYNQSTAYLFLALDFLIQADQKLRANDPGKWVLKDRIQQVKQLIHQPLDTLASPGVGVPDNPVRVYFKLPKR